MITLNNLINLYKDIANRHEQINGFMAVQDFDIDTVSQHYPILVVSPTSANLPRTDGGYTSFTTTFDLQVIDLVEKDESNRNEVLSDTQQILNEVINEFNTHPYYMDQGIDTISDINFEPLRGVYNTQSDGWKISITLELPNKISFCGTPIEDLSGFDFTPPPVTVIDGSNTVLLYPSDNYTCEIPDTVTLSGTKYHRNYHTLQTTSYIQYDDGWNVTNNIYDATNPETPLIYAELDLVTDPTGYTLKSNNEFGNKIRYTDTSGVASLDVQNIYVIDNWTGLAHWMTGNGAYKASYNNFLGTGGLLESYNASTLQGYSDWFVANNAIFNNILTYEGMATLSNAWNIPYRITSKDHYNSCTSQGAANNFYIHWQVGSQYNAKTTSRHWLMTRIHFK